MGCTSSRTHRKIKPQRVFAKIPTHVGGCASWELFQHHTVEIVTHFVYERTQCQNNEKEVLRLQKRMWDLSRKVVYIHRKFSEPKCHRLSGPLYYDTVVCCNILAFFLMNCGLSQEFAYVICFKLLVEMKITENVELRVQIDQLSQCENDEHYTEHALTLLFVLLREISQDRVSEMLEDHLDFDDLIPVIVLFVCEKATFFGTHGASLEGLISKNDLWLRDLQSKSKKATLANLTT